MSALNYGMVFFAVLATFCFMGVLSGTESLVIYTVLFLSSFLMLLIVSIDLENYTKKGGWRIK